MAGAWAILKQAAPSSTVPGILSALQTTGLPITDPRNGITTSRIEIFDALPAIGPPPGGYKTYTVAPCRLVDTRLAGGTIAAHGFRSFLAAGALSGQGGASDCVVPRGPSKAVHINVVAVTPSGPGHLTVHPYPTPLPLASTLNFSTGATIANGVVIPICDSGVTSCSYDFTVTMGPTAAHVVIDVTGCLAPPPW